MSFFENLMECFSKRQLLASILIKKEYLQIRDNVILVKNYHNDNYV